MYKDNSTFALGGRLPMEAITEWMLEDEPCGDVSNNAKTNIEWAIAEVDRLRRKDKYMNAYIRRSQVDEHYICVCAQRFK